MEIRCLEESDLQGLFALVSEVYADSPESMWFRRSPDEQTFGFIFREKLHGEKEGSVIDMVATENRRIIGECEIVKAGPKSGIIGIIVMPEMRRRGVGAGLLLRATGMARDMGLTHLMADVSRGNAGALGFFLRQGFSVIESRSGPDITLLEKQV